MSIFHSYHFSIPVYSYIRAHISVSSSFILISLFRAILYLIKRRCAISKYTAVNYSRVHYFSGAPWIRETLRVEISVVPPPVSLIPLTDGRVSNGDRSAVRYAGTCHENLSRRPLGRLGRTRAVARWDGNVALQRWGCGRCRPRDGGRGYRFTARRSPILQISRLLSAERVCALERNRFLLFWARFCDFFQWFTLPSPPRDYDSSFRSLQFFRWNGGWDILGSKRSSMIWRKECKDYRAPPRPFTPLTV